MNSSEYKDATPVKDLPLSVRAVHALMNHKYYFLSDMKSLTKEQLLSFRGIGAVIAEEIIDFLDSYLGFFALCGKNNALDTMSSSLDKSYPVFNLCSNGVPHKLEPPNAERTTNHCAYKETTPVEELPLSIRAVHALLNNNYHSLGDMRCLTEERLLSFRNIGLLTAEEIINFLGNYSELDDSFEETLTPDISNTIFSECLLFLSVRSKRILYEIGVSSCERLIQLTAAEIRAAQSAGDITISEILEVIEYAKERLLEEKEEIFFDHWDIPHRNFSIKKASISQDATTCLIKSGISTFSDLEKWSFEIAQNGSTVSPELEFASRLALESDFWQKKIEDTLYVSPIDTAISNAVTDLATESNYHLGVIHSFIKNCLLETCDIDFDSGTEDIIGIVCSSTKFSSSLLEVIESYWPNEVSLSELAGHFFSSTQPIVLTSVESVLDTLVQVGEVKSGDYGFLYNPQTFCEYIQNQEISIRTKGIIMRRLEGESLESIGEFYNLTRERVRQIEQRTLAKPRSKVKEDYFKKFFTEYKVEKKDFVPFFGTIQSYNFLRKTCKPGKLEINLAIENTELPQRIRDTVLRVSLRDCIQIDGIYVQKNRRDLVTWALSNYCQNEMAIEDFVSKYTQLLIELSLPVDELSIDERTYANYYYNDLHIFWKQNRRIRYYPADLYDFDQFLIELGLDQYRNVEISTLKIWRDYRDLMLDFDIRDEYELHSLLRKLLDGKKKNIVFSRMPTLIFGNGSREKQTKSLIFSVGEASAIKLGELYEEAYGVRAGTFIGSYLSVVEPYYDRRTRNYSIDHYGIKLEEQEYQALSRSLTEDFYLISEVEDIFKGLFSYSVDISGRDYAKMGFLARESYIVSDKYQSSAEFFLHMLLDGDYFALNEKSKKFFDLSSFRGVFKECRSKYELIESESNIFLTPASMFKQGISKAEMKDFVYAVYDFTEPEQCFTLFSLKKSGFCHHILEHTDDFFANSILSSPDIRFGYEKVFGTCLFERDTRVTSVTRLIVQIMGDMESISLHNLLEILSEQYGLSATRNKLYSMITREPLFFDSAREVIFKSRTAYIDSIVLGSQIL